MTKRAWLLVLASALGLATPALARADDARDQARHAYDRGTAAHARGEFTVAAREFARADELAPSSIALRAALGEVLLADDPALGMELVDRARRAPADPGVATAVVDVEAKFRGRAGRLSIACPKGHVCLATVDGAPGPVDRPFWVDLGQRSVVVQIDDVPQVRLVQIDAAQLREITPQLPGTAAAPASGSGDRGATGGIGTAVLGVGLGLTALALAGTIASGADTASKHAQFVAQGCPQSVGVACSDLSLAGASAQTRTDVLIGVTGSLGVISAIVGVVLATSSSRERADGHSSVSAAFVPGGAGATIPFW